MVRGPAPLLGATTLALAYFLVAGELPDLGNGDVAVLVAGLIGVGLVAGIVLAVTRAGDDLFPLSLLMLGSLILVAGMDAAGAGSSVSAFEAVAAGTFGVLLGRALAAPAVALAIPIFVAIVDAWSVASGPTSRLSESGARGASELTFDLPSWGGAPDAASRLGIVDAIFLAMFSVWAARFGLRPRATAIGMVLGLLAAVVLSVLLDRAVPALPLVAVGYWTANLDRFDQLLQRDRTE
ncbi:MAG: hypothetical protein JWM73_3050 [Solirubrobacterales bacterium]|nr:hypothetical protein [Solirubrobacterales bacterium]